MRQIPEHKRWKMTGKGRGHSFAALPHHLLQSKQFIWLEPWAKSLFLYWAGVYNGKNNGDFSAPKNLFRNFGFNSPATLEKAKKTLTETGFAVVTRHGHKRVCYLYGLTIWPIDDCEGKTEIRAETVARNSWKTESVGQQVSFSGTAGVLKPIKKAA